MISSTFSTWTSDHPNTSLSSLTTNSRKASKVLPMLKLRVFSTSPWFCSDSFKKKTPLKSITNVTWHDGFSTRNLPQMTLRRWWLGNILKLFLAFTSFLKMELYWILHFRDVIAQIRFVLFTASWSLSAAANSLPNLKACSRIWPFRTQSMMSSSLTCSTRLPRPKTWMESTLPSGYSQPDTGQVCYQFADVQA